MDVEVRQTPEAGHGGACLRLPRETGLAWRQPRSLACAAPSISRFRGRKKRPAIVAREKAKRSLMCLDESESVRKRACVQYNRRCSPYSSYAREFNSHFTLPVSEQRQG